MMQFNINVFGKYYLHKTAIFVHDNTRTECQIDWVITPHVQLYIRFPYPYEGSQQLQRKLHQLSWFTYKWDMLVLLATKNAYNLTGCSCEVKIIYKLPFNQSSSSLPNLRSSEISSF